MTIVNTVTKNVLHRAWTDLEPKLLAFLATGLSASLVIEAADYIGYPIQPGLAAVIVSLVGTIAGYVKSSTTKTVLPAADGSYSVTSLPATTPVVAAPQPPVQAAAAPVSVPAPVLAPEPHQAAAAPSAVWFPPAQNTPTADQIIAGPPLPPTTTPDAAPTA